MPEIDIILDIQESAQQLTKDLRANGLTKKQEDLQAIVDQQENISIILSSLDKLVNNSVRLVKLREDLSKIKSRISEFNKYFSGDSVS